MAVENEIIAATLQLARARGPEKTICPSEVARHIAGSDEIRWRPLMTPIRQVAVRLAKAGKIEIKQGGNAIDPENIDGIYRIGIKGP